MMPGGQVPLAGRNTAVVEGQDVKDKCDFDNDHENHDSIDDYDNRYGRDEHNDHNVNKCCQVSKGSVEVCMNSIETS